MKQISLLMLSAVLMLGSCSKSNDDSKPKEETCRVESIQNVSDKGTFNWSKSYTYDEKGRMKTSDYKEEYNGELVGYIEAFTYQSDKIIVEADSDNELYNLDASGRIASITFEEGSTNFSYNSEGYLSKITSSYNYSKPYTETSTLTYSNGNLIKIVTISESSGSTLIERVSNITYTNESVKVGLVQDIVTDHLFELAHDGISENIAGFLGKRSKNLISKVDMLEKGYGDESNHTTTYTYQKDTENNIKSMKEVSKSFYDDVNKDTSYEETYNFTYVCK